MTFHYSKSINQLTQQTGFRMTDKLMTCKRCGKRYDHSHPSIEKRMIGHYEYHIRGGM